MKSSQYLPACLAVGLAFAAGSAHAASPGHSGLFAVADQADVASSNPAGMTRLKGVHKTAQLIIGQGFSDFEVDEDLTTTSGGDPDNDNDPVFVPSFNYVRPIINDDWRFGFSVFVPSGFGTDYGGDWAGRYYSDVYNLVYVNLQPSIAWRMNEQWSFGAALAVTYTYTETEVAVNNIVPGAADARLEFDADSIGFSPSVSLLYEHDAQTRFGMAYVAEMTTDLEGDVEFKDLDPVLEAFLSARNMLTIELEVENVMPQRVQAGVYHQFDSGTFVTLDTVWVDFSEFGTGELTVGDEGVLQPEGIYDDMWLASAGIGWPMNNGMDFKLGMMHLTQAVDDEDRTLALALDEVWAVGAGVTREFGDSTMDLNLNFYKFGDAPVDTGTSLRRGRVVGESDTPYAVAIDFAWHW